MATSPATLNEMRKCLAVLAAALMVTGCGGGAGTGGNTSPTEQPESVTPPVAPNTSVTTTPVQAPATETPSSPTPTSVWGTFQKLFAADSPWNSRPVSPVFGSEVIPTSTYFPAVNEGAYSVGVFEARNSDGPMIVMGPSDGSGIWNPDTELYQPSITIPRWPDSVTPASGSDGHADIVDTTTGVVHSFFQLKKVDGVWRASQYAWSSLSGRGWGNPAHYFQGARSSGVPTSGGLIRTHEINDGDTMYRHALAMSLTYNGLAASPAYVFPATSADTNAATANTGSIPLGSLMMLPPSFDTSSIENTDLRKIAETLKTYGAYVVDRNVGTPFLIYAELGSGFSLHKNGWNTRVGNDLHTIRAALRRVVGASNWIDGEGRNISRSATSLNLISMRGPWVVSSGATTGVFDSWQQALVFPASDTVTTQFNTSPNIFGRLSWGKPTPGMRLRITARTTGGAQLKLQLTDCTNPSNNVDTGFLRNGESATFVWPANRCGSRLTAISGNSGSSTAKAELLSLD